MILFAKNSDSEWLALNLQDFIDADLEYFVERVAIINDDFTTPQKLEESRKQALLELKKYKQEGSK
jgi:hypothetical protein